MLTDRSPAKAKTPGEGARPSASGRGMTSCRWFRVWRKSEDGGTAVEFAFVLPVLLMIIAGIMQFGAIFFLQNNMANAAREAARALAVGSISSKAESENLVEQKLIDWGVNFNIVTDLPNPADPNDTDYTVTITAPLSEAAIFDYLGVFEGGELRAASDRGAVIVTV